MGTVSIISLLVTLGFIGWLIYRGARKIQVEAHHITYGIAVVTGIYTYGFFLSMDIPQLFKVVASIFLGMVLIVLAALLQRRRQQPGKP